jgi:hypothetical protein
MKKLLVTLALGAALMSTPVLAQAPGGGGRSQRDQTRAEAQQRADMMFQMIDANKDGTVTRAEAEQAVAKFQAARGGDDQSGRGGGRMQRMIGEAFGTADSLSLQQFEALALARFDSQDLNHDGTVSSAERQQLRDQRQAQGAPVAPAQPQ